MLPEYVTWICMLPEYLNWLNLNLTLLQFVFFFALPLRFCPDSSNLKQLNRDSKVLMFQCPVRFLNIGHMCFLDCFFPFSFWPFVYIKCWVENQRHHCLIITSLTVFKLKLLTLTRINVEICLIEKLNNLFSCTSLQGIFTSLFPFFSSLGQ